MFSATEWVLHEAVTGNSVFQMYDQSRHFGTQSGTQLPGIFDPEFFRPLFGRLYWLRASGDRGGRMSLRPSDHNIRDSCRVTTRSAACLSILAQSCSILPHEIVLFLNW